MKRDAESHAAEDKKRREVIDLKNQGESFAYATEKSLKEYGDKVDAGRTSPPPAPPRHAPNAPACASSRATANCSRPTAG